VVSFPLGEGEGVLGEVSFLFVAFAMGGVIPLPNACDASVPPFLTLPFPFLLPS